MGVVIPSTTTGVGVGNGVGVDVGVGVGNGVGVDVGVGVKVGVAVGPNEIFKGPKLQDDIVKDTNNNKPSTITLFLFTIASF